MKPGSARAGLFRVPGFAVLVCLICLSACAPTIQGTGPAVRHPILTSKTFVTADGARLPMRVWAAEQPRAVIVALHGFNDYSRAFEWPAAYWARNGITTYAYDQRGFGRTARAGIWPGTDTLIGDLAQVSALVHRHHPGVPLYWLGESMGGAVALAAMARTETPDVAGLILVAPAVWGWARMNVFYETALWLGAHTIPWKTFTGANLKIQASDNIVVLRQLFRDPLVIKATRTDALYGLVNMMDLGYFASARVRVPTLVLHGAHDQIVPGGPVRTMASRLAGPHRFVEYAHGYHMLLRDQRGPMLWRDVRDWIGNPRAVLFGRDTDPNATPPRAARS